MPSTNYNAYFSNCDLSEEDNEYYDCQMIIKTKNNYNFCAGGGLVLSDEVERMKNFIEKGSLQVA